MKRAWLAALILLAGCSKAPPGNIEGVIRFVGTAPPPKTISMEAEEACQGLHTEPVVEQLVTAGPDGGLANAFVYVKAGLQGQNFEPPKQAVVLDQHGCQFVPRVVALRAGQTLEVKNSDPVSHNIHPMPVNNRDWNQQQPPGAENLKRRFARPEVMIPVKCNIHSWMRTYIAVLDHPFFAVTGSDGKFRFAGLPPGRYTIAAWHEGYPEMTETVEVKPGGTIAASFTFR